MIRFNKPKHVLPKVVLKSEQNLHLGLAKHKTSWANFLIFSKSTSEYRKISKIFNEFDICGGSYSSLFFFDIILIFGFWLSNFFSFYWSSKPLYSSFVKGNNYHHYVKEGKNGHNKDGEDKNSISRVPPNSLEEVIRDPRVMDPSSPK